MDRTPLINKYLDLAKRGLELGPSHRPSVRKSDGYPVEILDHASRAELQEKYRAHGLDPASIAAIEEVDHVWSGGPLIDAVPEHGAYHWIIAAHFIEHTVDLIGFLRDCSTLLAEGGAVFLIVPDKRYTFDRFRSLTSLGDVLAQSDAATRFHPVGPVIDHLVYAVLSDGNLTFEAGAPGQATLLSGDSLSEVPDVETRSLAQTEYHDIHRWIFTPGSLALLIEDLREIGRHDLKVEQIVTDRSYEFAMVLRRDASPFVRTTPRLDALLAIEGELNGPEKSEAQAQARAEVDALRSSTSWRVTAPLRAISSAAKRIFKRG